MTPRAYCCSSRERRHLDSDRWYCQRLLGADTKKPARMRVSGVVGASPCQLLPDAESFPLYCYQSIKLLIKQCLINKHTCNTTKNIILKLRDRIFLRRVATHGILECFSWLPSEQLSGALRSSVRGWIELVPRRDQFSFHFLCDKKWLNLIVPI